MFLLSPRMALQLKWNRTVNTHGRPGKNIPCDLYMEHLNRECKTSLAGLGSNINDHSVQRIGRCIGKIIPILQNFDKINGVPTQLGYHSHRSSTADLNKIIGQLTEVSKVFHREAGRNHHHFSKFKSNIMHKISHPALNQWMLQQLRKLCTYH